MSEQRQYLTFMGTRIFFSVVTPEQPVKNRILLLSSPLINSFHWRKLLPELTELGCLVVMVDYPGFGLSDCVSSIPQDHDLIASMIWGILDDIDTRTETPMAMWHLAAHGLACSTLLRMVQQYPDSVKSQIHISPLFCAELNKKSAAELPERIRATIDSEAQFVNLIEQWAGYPLNSYILERMRKPLLRPGAANCFLRMVRHNQTAPTEGMGFCPAIVLRGGRDPLMTESAVRIVRELLPDAENHLLKSAGHFPMETHSHALRDYLRGWIRFND